MNDLKKILFCCRINFYKAVISPKIYIVLALALCCQYYAFHSLIPVCRYFESPVSAWLFPFWIVNPVSFLMVGGMNILLYCDMPNLDRQSAFTVIRAGRRNWILGQILYVLFSAFLYTVWSAVSSWLFLFPYLTFEKNWGRLLGTLAADPGIVRMAGVTYAGFSLNEDMLRTFSPAEAMGLSVLLYFCGAALFGLIILCLGLLRSGLCGIAVCGAFTAIAYFARYLGAINFHGFWDRLSPISWVSMFCVDWYGNQLTPGPGYVFSVYGASGVLLTVLSVAVFCKKDIVFEEKGR